MYTVSGWSIFLSYTLLDPKRVSLNPSMFLYNLLLFKSTYKHITMYQSQASNDVYKSIYKMQSKYRKIPNISPLEYNPP